MVLRPPSSFAIGSVGLGLRDRPRSTLTIWRVIGGFAVRRGRASSHRRTSRRSHQPRSGGASARCSSSPSSSASSSPCSPTFRARQGPPVARSEPALVSAVGRWRWMPRLRGDPGSDLPVHGAADSGVAALPWSARGRIDEARPGADPGHRRPTADARITEIPAVDRRFPNDKGAALRPQGTSFSACCRSSGSASCSRSSQQFVGINIILLLLVDAVAGRRLHRERLTAHHGDHERDEHRHQR